MLRHRTDPHVGQQEVALRKIRCRPPVAAGLGRGGVATVLVALCCACCKPGGPDARTVPQRDAGSAAAHHGDADHADTMTSVVVARFSPSKDGSVEMAIQRLCKELGVKGQFGGSVVYELSIRGKEDAARTARALSRSDLVRQGLVRIVLGAQ